MNRPLRLLLCLLFAIAAYAQTPSVINDCSNSSAIAANPISISSCTLGGSTFNTQLGDLMMMHGSRDTGPVGTMTPSCTGVTTWVKIGTDVQGQQVGNWYTRYAGYVTTASSTATCSATYSTSQGGNTGIDVQQARNVYNASGVASALDTSATANTGALLTTLTVPASGGFTTAGGNELLLMGAACGALAGAPYSHGACGTAGNCTLDASNGTVGSQHILFSTTQSTQTATISWTVACGPVAVVDIFKAGANPITAHPGPNAIN